MARITVQDCLSKIGNENRFALVHLAVQRVRQHRDGQPFLVQCKNKEIVSTLREIAAGDISFETIAEYDHVPAARRPAALETPVTTLEVNGEEDSI
jgi:DNA-directed RNA polymerase subunit omega